GLVAGCGTGRTEKSGNNKAADQQAAKKPAVIRIGYQTADISFIVAKQKGWLKEEFAKDGIELKYEKFISGPPMIEAFAGNRLDFGMVGDQPAIQAKANNIDIKAVGVPISGPKTLGLVVPNGSQIKSPKELKGKKVGVTIGSVGHQLLYLYLQSNGLTPQDVQQVNLQPADIKTALAAKNIDAAVTWEPFISVIESENIGREIADATGLKTNANLIIVPAEFTKQYPDIVKRFLKVLDKSAQWIKKNPQESIQIVAQDTQIDPKILEKTFPKYNNDVQITDEVIKSVQQTSDFLRKNNIIRKDINAKDLIDTSYLKAIGIQ
ncbi:MAG TPA: aliphatic sulfonate ABC transporter substrate-binding protein, partial [Syntrophomonadaceae bacterium]|nr:aliphatic sulfonate ABC transporter substrate-binding protein [Syntrophomonadaceae bacterium]